MRIAPRVALLAKARQIWAPGVIVASRYGPISYVTPLTGAYPVVTLAFAALVLKERISPLQYLCIAAIIIGMLLCTQ